MFYKCKRCGFICDQKNGLRRHLNRKSQCEPNLEDIDIETLKLELEKPKNKITVQTVYNLSKDVSNLSEDVSNPSEDVSSLSEDVCEKSESTVKIIGGKYQCSECKKLFKEKKYLDEHIKRNCKMLINYNNIYNYNTKTFGNNKYGSGGGDVYIVQTDFNQDNIFKIGVTTNIYRRMIDYRCGAVLEPRLYYYYPFKNIKQADIDLKNILYEYRIKREIFKSDIDTFRNKIKEYQMNVDNEITEIEPELKDCDIVECKHCSLCFYDNDSMFKHLVICDNYKQYIMDSKANRYECKYCKKLYSKNSNLHRHMKICKKKENEEAKKQDEVAELKEKLAQKDKEMETLIGYTKEQIDFMKKQIEILMKKAGNNTTNTDNRTINNTDNSINDNKQINININGFGKEDLSYLTDKYFRELFNIPFSAITTLVEDIHFNPEKPQNWNAKIQDDKTSKALVYNAEKEMWVKREKKEVINEMVEKSYNMLDANFDIQKEAKTLDDKGKRKFENFMKIYDKGNKELNKRYETEVREKLMNYKEYHTK